MPVGLYDKYYSEEGLSDNKRPGLIFFGFYVDTSIKALQYDNTPVFILNDGIVDD